MADEDGPVAGEDRQLGPQAHNCNQESWRCGNGLHKSPIYNLIDWAERVAADDTVVDDGQDGRFLRGSRRWAQADGPDDSLQPVSLVLGLMIGFAAGIVVAHLINWWVQNG